MNFLHAKNLGKILTLTLVLVIGVSLVAMPHALAATSTGGSGVPQVNPQANGFSLLGLNMVDMVNSIFANLVNAILGVTSIFVAITGQLLNFSIVVTLHIKDFVDNTPAIYAIWSVIRDVASLFFIFFLLYEAIKIILNTSASYGKTLVNIVAAGILINFSFFIVSIGIDASNIISQAIYNSILPNQPAVSFSGGASLANIATTFNGGSGGLSGIFMSNLKVTTFYNAQSLNF
ncbi:MAG: hypothetical protein KGJ33_02875, partial [Patescibacteria group bacterium]|nr:hypothetical protein [Patescibacteria group bacterium]